MYVGGNRRDISEMVGGELPTVSWYDVEVMWGGGGGAYREACGTARLLPN